LRAVQELLGHSDPGTTAGYAAYANASALAAVNGLPVPGKLFAVVPPSSAIETAETAEAG
jgi:hypothetical protein